MMRRMFLLRTLFAEYRARVPYVYIVRIANDVRVVWNHDRSS
jgi:hypothetical protein